MAAVIKVSPLVSPRWDFAVTDRDWLKPDEQLCDALLRVRGQNSAQFLASPQLSDIALLPEHPLVIAALDRVRFAIANRQKILICGDYDVDGISGTALLWQGLTAMGAEVSWYIPHRHDEGYGLSLLAVEQAAARGIALIITVDCGISDAEKIIAAKAKGIDVVITDHHRVPDQLPPAAGIVHPQVFGAAFDGIVGVGTAFKLIYTLAQRYFKTVDVQSLLDLVALGTIADVSPMVSENRILVRLGLQQLNRLQRPGLIAIAQLAQRTGPYTEEDVGFVFAPRMNAAGRLEHASQALELLLAPTLEKALPLAQQLEDLNEERRGLTHRIYLAALAQLSEPQPPCIVLYDPTWHAGVTGIVASKLVERFGCPVFLLAGKDGLVRGSGRSVPGVNLHGLLTESNPGFMSFGGHAMAGGFSLAEAKVPLFAEQFAVACRRLPPEHLGPRVSADAWLDEQHITMKNCETLGSLRPFGAGHTEPVFASDTLILKELRPVGRERTHAKLKFQSRGQREKIFDGIGFGLAEQAARAGKDVEILFGLGINEYMGRRSVQLMVKDIRPQTVGR